MKDLYREETNHDVYADYCCENTAGSYADEYVRWLEEKLNKLSQHDVSRQSELLCDFLEWYDVDLTLEEREMEIKTYMDMKSHNCY